MGASCSDFLLFLLILLAGFLLPFSHSASSHTGPSPVLPSAEYYSVTSLSGADFYMFGLVGGGMTSLHRAGSILEPPPVSPPIQTLKMLLQCHLALPGCFTQPPALQALESTVSKPHAHSCIFLTKREVLSPEDVCLSPNSKALHCNQPLKQPSSTLYRLYCLSLRHLLEFGTAVTCAPTAPPLCSAAAASGRAGSSQG